MQGSARKDVVFGAAGVYPVTVPGPKWKSWLSVRPHGFGYVAQAFNLGNRGELRQRFHGAVGLVPGSQVTVAREVVAYNRN